MLVNFTGTSVDRARTLRWIAPHNALPPAEVRTTRLSAVEAAGVPLVRHDDLRPWLGRRAELADVAHYARRPSWASGVEAAVNHAAHRVLARERFVASALLMTTVKGAS